MITWPEALPLGIKYGAEDEIGKGNKISTDMDYGPKKRRRRFTNNPNYQSITISFTDDQYTQFISWYSAVLMDGICSFYAPVLVGSDIAVKRCTIDDDSLKISHGDWNRHTVSMVLEIYDPLPTDGGSAWIIGMYGWDFFVQYMADPLQYEVNVHYPEIMVNY